MITYYSSPLGCIEIEETDNKISALRFVNTSLKTFNEKEIPLLDECKKQLDEYFSGKRKQFDLPLHITGTDFQEKAWNYLLSIPYGTTVSYKDQALAIGSSKAYRAVGSANGKNHIAIIIPCHRVINNRNGLLGGYAYGLDIKRYLLELENRCK